MISANSNAPSALLDGGSLIDKMAAFDALPQRVRQRLANAEFNISPINALSLYRRYGENYTIKLIGLTERNIKKLTPFPEYDPDRED